MPDGNIRHIRTAASLSVARVTWPKSRGGTLSSRTVAARRRAVARALFPCGHSHQGAPVAVLFQQTFWNKKLKLAVLTFATFAALC
jgi:hypothetical protein